MGAEEVGMDRKQIQEECRKIEKKHAGVCVIALNADCSTEEICVLHGAEWLDALADLWEGSDDDK